MEDEKIQKLEKWHKESSQMYTGYHAPYSYKGNEYWIDQKHFAEADAMEGVKRQPIFIW